MKKIILEPFSTRPLNCIVEIEVMPLKKVAQFLFFLFLVLLCLIIAIDNWISDTTASYIYNDIEKMPKTKIGVVLGTSKYVRGGGSNPFYQQRILGAAALYFNHKIDKLLLSGDNATSHYNEPVTMKRDLLSRGIPNSAISLDYAGFRTLDSVIRAHKIFGAQNFTIITQKFHCERALFIALNQNISAQCYAVTSPPHMKMMRIREIFARASAFIDLYILNKRPKHLGVFPSEKRRSLNTSE